MSLYYIYNRLSDYQTVTTHSTVRIKFQILPAMPYNEIMSFTHLLCPMAIMSFQSNKLFFSYI